MDLEKLKNNNIKLLEISECKKEIENILEQINILEDKYNKNINKYINGNKESIDKFLTEELSFLKDPTEKSTIYRLENDEVGKLTVSFFNDNILSINLNGENRGFNYSINDKDCINRYSDWDSMEYELEDYLKNKRITVSNKSEWNNKLNDIKDEFEEMTQELENGINGVTYLINGYGETEMKYERYKYLVDFIKEEIEKL